MVPIWPFLKAKSSKFGLFETVCQKKWFGQLAIFGPFLNTEENSLF
jgi:hypothetical protein